jgi:hypothetical protein
MINNFLLFFIMLYSELNKNITYIWDYVLICKIMKKMFGILVWTTLKYICYIPLFI